MGMWGMGVFENDSALNYLDAVVADLAQRIRAALGMELRDREVVAVKPLEQVELADIDRVVLPSAAILVRLCANPADIPSQSAHRRLTGGLLERIEAQTAGVQLPAAGDQSWPDAVLAWSATPPAAAIVRAWRKRALAAFSANLRSDLTSADYREKRPAIIKLTFDRLEALAAEAEQW
jgi:hypothetical protein